jgi:hypothetical protein
MMMGTVASLGLRRRSPPISRAAAARRFTVIRDAAQLIAGAGDGERVLTASTGRWLGLSHGHSNVGSALDIGNSLTSLIRQSGTLALLSANSHGQAA